MISSSGQTLAFAVLLVKNWRIYKIFYNNRLKKKVKIFSLQNRYSAKCIYYDSPHLESVVIFEPVNFDSLQVNVIGEEHCARDSL